MRVVHRSVGRSVAAPRHAEILALGLAGDPRLRDALHEYFAWSTTGPMARYHESADEVPDGLAIPRWSWDGLVDPEG